MKIISFGALLFSLYALPLYAAPAEQEAPKTAPAMLDILTTLKPSHPRLLASATTWDALKERRRNDAELDAFLKRGEVEARALLGVPPMPYKKDGKRLLHVSRGGVTASFAAVHAVPSDR